VRTEGSCLPEGLLLLPERRVYRTGIGGVDADFVRAGVLVFVQHLLERATTVGRAVHPAFRVGTIRVPERRDEQPVGIRRVDVDIRDHLCRIELATEVSPGATGID